MEAQRLDTKKLDDLLKLLKESKNLKARVGIIGQKAIRKNDEGLSNADIGAFHEFGTSKLPVRSFLKMPISENLVKRLKEAGLPDDETMKEVIKEKSILPWLKKIGVAAEAVVLEAFDTGGFGKWQPSNMAKKQNQQTLVETQQLRNSISHDIVEVKS